MIQIDGWPSFRWRRNGWQLASDNQPSSPVTTPPWQSKASSLLIVVRAKQIYSQTLSVQKHDCGQSRCYLVLGVTTGGAQCLGVWRLLVIACSQAVGCCNLFLPMNASRRKAFAFSQRKKKLDFHPSSIKSASIFQSLWTGPSVKVFCTFPSSSYFCLTFIFTTELSFDALLTYCVLVSLSYQRSCS